MAGKHRTPEEIVGKLRQVIATAGDCRNFRVWAGMMGEETPQGPTQGALHSRSAQFYAFALEVRRLLYTTNAIEALNSRLRRAVRARGHFPNDDAALKLLFLVLNRSEKEWTMPAREWCMAKAQFAVLSGERFTRAMA